jgi:hypothetical protein
MIVTIKIGDRSSFRGPKQIAHGPPWVEIRPCRVEGWKVRNRRDLAVRHGIRDGRQSMHVLRKDNALLGFKNPRTLSPV